VNHPKCGLTHAKPRRNLGDHSNAVAGQTSTKQCLYDKRLTFQRSHQRSRSVSPDKRPRLAAVRTSKHAIADTRSHTGNRCEVETIAVPSISRIQGQPASRCVGIF
jgi:hypothetical protein